MNESEMRTGIVSGGWGSMGRLAFDIGEGYKSMEIGGNSSKDGGRGRNRVTPNLKMCYIHPLKWLVKVRRQRKGHQNIQNKKKQQKPLSESSRCLAYLTFNTWVLLEVNKTSE